MIRLDFNREASTRTWDLASSGGSYDPYLTELKFKLFSSNGNFEDIL